MSTAQRLRAIVRGRVQGVFFRDFARTQSTGLGLTGYVRNRPDGTVEVVAEGPREELEKLRGLLKIGPPSARVETVEAQWGLARGEYDRFEVRY